MASACHARSGPRAAVSHPMAVFIRIFENRCPPRLTPGPPRGASSSRPPAPPCGTCTMVPGPGSTVSARWAHPPVGQVAASWWPVPKALPQSTFPFFYFLQPADVVWSSCSFHPRRQVHTPPPPSPFTPRPHPVNHRVSCPVIRMYWTQGETLTDDNKRVEHHALDTARYAAQGGQ